MKTFLISTFLLLAFVGIVSSCGAPKPRPPPETIDGLSGEFIVDPRIIIENDETWTCKNSESASEFDCYTRFRVTLFMELDMFDSEGVHCECGIAVGGPDDLFNEKRAVASYLGAIVESISFVTFDVTRNLQTGVISNFQLNFDVGAQANLQSLLEDPADFFTSLDGFLGLVTNFTNDQLGILADDESVYVKFVVTITYDTSQSSTSVAPAENPGCLTALNSVPPITCGIGEVTEAEVLNEQNGIPFPNFAFKVATGEATETGQSTGGHPADFSPGTYAAGECANDTMCNYCESGTNECFPGYCNNNTNPGQCRMCMLDEHCARFDLPNLQPEPFFSVCNPDNNACTRKIIRESDTTSSSVPTSFYSVLF